MVLTTRYHSLCGCKYLSLFFGVNIRVILAHSFFVFVLLLLLSLQLLYCYTADVCFDHRPLLKLMIWFHSFLLTRHIKIPEMIRAAYQSGDMMPK